MVHRTGLLLSLMVAAPPSGDAQAGCPAAGAARLDHAIVVVNRLDVIGARLRALGFRIKPGHLHPNHLLNLHVKFADSTQLEVMTLAGAPRDANARDYAALLAIPTLFSPPELLLPSFWIRSLVTPVGPAPVEP